ncbi:MAG TPA: class I SAM-dependent methyltransferase [Solirubrobacteraceae bacterium]|nr:class I SAM-dependent methyltransferase [Solirubrobacteraceae bacterium]
MPLSFLAHLHLHGSQRAPAEGGDPDVELVFWTGTWDAHIRAGDLFAPGGLELLGEAAVAADYEGRRWQEARAQVRRILREAAIDDPDFFAGKVVAEIGPGPVGFPEACGAQTAIAIEPLAPRLAAAGLLLGRAAVYLACGAERIPLLDASVDVIVIRNALDHVADPAAVMGEAGRLLRPGGTLILNVDVDSAPTEAEPHTFTVEDVRRLVAPLQIDTERVTEEPHGHTGRQMVVVARASQGGSTGRSRPPP